VIAEMLEQPVLAELPRHRAPTIEDLFLRYGPMPATRIRLDRFPATEEDVDELRNTTRRLYELVDGVLLEKAMGAQESFIALEIGTSFKNFLKKTRLGAAYGADGMMRIAPGLVRIPDVSFVSWDQHPNRCVPSTPVPDLHPDLAVEVLSESNTKREMDEKLANYFEAGTTLVWYVDPESRSVRVYTSPEQFTMVPVTGTLDGGTVLPGFTLPVADIFAELPPANE
jgi:Uma2 family endonuclease